MRNASADVLIVGAGPAGSATALRLARLGHDVLIVERSDFPRDKPCGDTVNPGALYELKRLGIAGRIERRLRPWRIGGWRIEAPDGASLAVDYGSDGRGGTLVGWGVRRRDLDWALLDEAVRAGARVIFGLRVFDLLWESGRAAGVLGREGTSRRALRACFLIGADGLRSVVQRRLGLTRRRSRLRKIAVVGHLAAANGEGDAGELRVSGGRCCGYAPQRVGANITLVLPEAESTCLGGAPREFLIGALTAFPEVLDRVRGRGLEPQSLVTGPFDRPVARPWSPGALLVGDAAGYYDPLTGQGIHQALLSARLAARAVDAMRKGMLSEAAALRGYARALERRMRPKRWVQGIIEGVVTRPPLMSRFVGALAAEESELGRRLLRVTGDIAHPATLLSPAVWTRLMYRLTYGGE